MMLRDTIRLALGLAGVGSPDADQILERWEGAGSPPLSGFAPYAAHVFNVDLLYYLGVGRGLISGRRASNKADMAYLTKAIGLIKRMLNRSFESTLEEMLEQEKFGQETAGRTLGGQVREGSTSTVLFGDGAGTPRSTRCCSRSVGGDAYRPSWAFPDARRRNPHPGRCR